MLYKKQNILFLFFIITCFINQDVFSQNLDYNVSEITIDHILYNNSITAIEQDSLGFLWIGTLRGLFKYDGITSERVNLLDEKYFLRQINAIYRDKNNNIWIALDNIVFLLNKSNLQFSSFDFNSIFKNKTKKAIKIFKISEDDLGNILFFSSFHIIKYNIKSNNFEIFYFEKSFFSINSVLTKDNRIILSFLNNIISLDKNDIRQNEINIILNRIQFKENKKSQVNFISSLHSFSTEYFLIDKNKGLKSFYLKNNEVIIKSKFNNQLDKVKDKVIFLYIDRNNKFWIITNDLNLYVFLPTLNELIALSDKFNITSFNLSPITTITEDNCGNIFLGLRNSSLIKISALNYNTFFIKLKKNNQDHIFSFIEDKNGRFFISSGKNIYSYIPYLANNNSHIIYTNKQYSLHNLRLNTNGELFFNDKNNLFSISFNSKSKNTRTIFHLEKTNNEIIYDYIIYKDKYFIFAKSIYVVDSDGKIIKKISFPSKEYFYITCEGENGYYHIITDKFFYTLNLNNYDIKKEIPLSDDLKDVAGFITISRASSNTFWLSFTNKGLYQLKKDEKKNKYLLKKENINHLIDNCFINNIIIDNNKLWLAINKLGLWYYDPETKFATNVYLKEEENNSIFLNKSYILSSDKILYLGCKSGFFRIIPNKNINNKKNNLLFTNFSFSNEIIDYQKLLSLKDITLPDGVNSFSFQCSLLDYNNPSKNIYKCFLENYDTTWNLLGNKNSFSYSNLEDGKYILKVLAINANGVSSSDTLHLTITIPTPFYRSWLGILLYLFFIFIIVYLIFYQKQKSNEKKLKQLREYSKQFVELQEKERSRISRELHDGINQVLSYAKIKLNSLHERLEKSSIEELEKVEKLLDDTNTEIRRISHNLHPIILDDLGLQKALLNLIRTYKERYNIELDFIYENLPSVLPKELQINIYRIIQEGLNNIIKHSKANKALIKLGKKEEKLSILIQDNGIGFNVLTNEHFGFGLKNIKERVNFFKGSIRIDSFPSKGTEIYIEIPLKEVENGK